MPTHVLTHILYNEEVFVVNSDGTGLTQITTNNVNDLSPSISGYGSKIAFESNADGNYDIYVINLESTLPTPTPTPSPFPTLTASPTPSPTASPTVSPDSEPEEQPVWLYAIVVGVIVAAIGIKWYIVRKKR